MTTTHAVVFDCDGVLVDSERINNEVFAELATRAGIPTSFQESVERYMGRSTTECVAELEIALGRPIGFDFAIEYELQVMHRQRDLNSVAGVPELLARLTTTDIPICVASSGTPSEIAFRLQTAGLARYFGRHCYSAAQVSRGKPAPDLFLLAAAKIGVDPAHCVLIEDSPYGVRGGRSAGMHVIGYAAMTSPGRLRTAGANHVVTSMTEVANYLGLGNSGTLSGPRGCRATPTNIRS